MPDDATIRRSGVRVLLLEDDPVDAELTQVVLADAGLAATVRVVATRNDFEHALDEWPCDLVLSDYNLGAFDGLTALSIVRARQLELPVIIVTGTIGEERAVELLKAGATDYVLKNRLAKLPLVVARALEEARERARAREAAEALEWREQEYRALVEEVPAVFFVIRADDGAALYVSPQVEGLLGFTQAEWLANPRQWFQSVHPEDRERMFAAWERGRRERRTIDEEHRLIRKDGGIVWVRAIVRFPESQTSIARGFASDISQRKRLEAQFMQAQKMEVMGRLAGGVAHDFNNLLTVINGYADLLLGGMSDDHPMRADLEQILQAGQRAADLTRQILAFSRKQVVQPIALDLNEELTRLAKMLPRLVGDDVQIVMATAPALDRIKIDPGHLHQIVMNVVVNARDAMPHGGRITLATEDVNVDEVAAREHGARPGSYVQLAVIDTGHGIPPEIRARVFEPFFTTKGPGKGTGLGLATVQSVASVAGGFVLLDSEVGRGTTIRVLFPRYEGPAEESRAAIPRPSRPHAATVLVVDDAPSLRRLVTTVLSSQGYRTLEAADGLDALRICEDTPIDLLITDVLMRPMTGVELARLFRRTQPDAHVLFMSGYADRELASDLLADDATYLAKPFTASALAVKVGDVLAHLSR